MIINTLVMGNPYLYTDPITGYIPIQYGIASLSIASMSFHY